MMEGEEGQVHAMHLADEPDEMEEEIEWYEPIRGSSSSTFSADLSH